MNENKSLFEDFFSEYDDNIDDNIHKMSQSNIWVDNLIIQALYNSFKFDIIMYSDTSYDVPMTITTDKNIIKKVVINIAYVN